jgi:hypothetical protein
MTALGPRKHIPLDPKLVWTSPRLDPSECIGGTAANGRIFYTGHAGGLQTSLIPASGCSPRAAASRLVQPSGG